MQYEVRDEMFTLLGHLEFGEIAPNQPRLTLEVYPASENFGRLHLDIKPAVDHDRNRYAVLCMQAIPENLAILNKFDAFTPVAT
jgi:hypothetical protein